MRPKRPAGGDVPPDFNGKQRFTEKHSKELLQMNVDLGRHNLEVTLKRFRDDTFRVAKEVALEGNDENTRQMDDYVRKVFTDDKIDA